MTFVAIRTSVFFIISFPVGFIFVSLVFAATQTPILAPAIFPWTLAIAITVGIAGGFRKAAE